MKNTSLNKIYIFGIFGVLASLGVGLGEFLLHYSPGGLGLSSDTFEFFNYVPLQRLTLGHFIAIAFTPFYVAGYYHFYLVFKEKNPKVAVLIFALGTSAFMIGGMWIASRAQLGYLVHKIAEFPNDNALFSLIEVYKNHSEILVNVLRFFMVFISLLFAIPILKGQTIYPKWFALFNPVFLLITTVLFFKFIPTIAYYITPIAMNYTHFILFTLSLFLIKKQSK